MSDRPPYVPVTEAMFRAMRRLDPVEASEFADMLYIYAFDGDEPGCDGAAAAVFDAVRPGLDWALADVRRRGMAENVIPDGAVEILSDEYKPRWND